MHGTHQAASHIPAIADAHLPTQKGYGGLTYLGPGCKEQLAHGCYSTAPQPAGLKSTIE